MFFHPLLGSFLKHLDIFAAVEALTVVFLHYRFRKRRVDFMTFN